MNIIAQTLLIFFMVLWYSCNPKSSVQDNSRAAMEETWTLYIVKQDKLILNNFPKEPKDSTFIYLEPYADSIDWKDIINKQCNSEQFSRTNEIKFCQFYNGQIHLRSPKTAPTLLKIKENNALIQADWNYAFLYFASIFEHWRETGTRCLINAEWHYEANFIDSIRMKSALHDFDSTEFRFDIEFYKQKILRHFFNTDILYLKEREQFNFAANASSKVPLEFQTLYEEGIYFNTTSSRYNIGIEKNLKEISQFFAWYSNDFIITRQAQKQYIDLVDVFAAFIANLPKELFKQDTPKQHLPILIRAINVFFEQHLKRLDQAVADFIKHILVQAQQNEEFSHLFSINNIYRKFQVYRDVY